MIRVYHPLPWQKANFRFWRFLSINKLSMGFAKLNRRNHRKTCIIDNRIAFVGGMNISSKHVAEKKAWRDSSARVEGDSASHLTRAFELAWKYHQKFHPMRHAQSNLPTRPGDVRLNSTRKIRRLAYRDLIRRVIKLKTRVWITNPYFVPDLTLLPALRFAAWSGHDVRLLVPSESDDWVCIGSSNLNQRSLLHDLEADVTLSQSSSVKTISEQFEEDQSNSTEVTITSWTRRPWLHKLLGKLILVFKRWI